MLIFDFRRGGETVTVPADNLRTATLLLPIHWRHGHLAGFSVTCRPVTCDLDFYRARCAFLEHQVRELLRRPYAQGQEQAAPRHH